MPNNNTLRLLKEKIKRNKNQHAIPPLDGSLLPNNLLDSFVVISDSLKAPDDITISEDGRIYVSTEKRVVLIQNDKCTEAIKIVEFDAPVGGLDATSDGNLVACVSGCGVAIVKDGNVVQWVESANGVPIKCPLSTVMGPDGLIYILDGSVNHKPEEWFFDLMEKRHSGRLISYNPKTEEKKEILTGLSYPHGLKISNDGKWLIISESWSHSLSCYPLNEICDANEKIILPNLPGYPGRLSWSSDGGYWMCIYAMRTHLVEFVLNEKKFRKEMMKSVDPAYWVRPALSSGADFFEPLQAAHAITLGIIKPWAPPRSYGLIVKLNSDLQIIESMHSRVGNKRHGITGVIEKYGDLFIVSKGGNFVLKYNKKVVS